MKDLILGEDGDLLSSHNDLYVGKSDEQHKHLLLTVQKGAIKQFPGTGVGIATYLESDDVGGLLREIAIQWTADGMTINKLTIIDTQLIYDAEYK